LNNELEELWLERLLANISTDMASFGINEEDNEEA
jgi:hypothetical protein